MERRFPASAWMLVMLLVAGLSGNGAQALLAKEKVAPVDTNDPTYRLFQLLDTARSGKLTDFYLIADVYKDPANPNVELQHILRADYDKNRGFARLSLYVRSVGKIAPEQMRVYTPKEFYEFGLADLEKFMKTDPGPFGGLGDAYLHSDGERPLATAPITDDMRRAYELFVTQHLLPALQKK
jgi:hypothetical protein